jgi:protein transport protein SEC61 subunit beta
MIANVVSDTPTQADVRPSSPAGGASSSAVARPPGANAVRLVLVDLICGKAKQYLTRQLLSSYSRRAPTAPKPTSTRAAGAGGSSNTMLKLYTDSGETGLQV